MAWEWSHTEEAYSNALDNLIKQEHFWLAMCLAEITASTSHPDYCGDHILDDKKYDLYRSKYEAWEQDDLINAIWRFAEEYRTCDNGGFNAHVCPYGCHTVSFDNED